MAKDGILPVAEIGILYLTIYTVRIAGAEADIHSGADASTVETVLRILKSC